MFLPLFSFSPHASCRTYGRLGFLCLSYDDVRPGDYHRRPSVDGYSARLFLYQALGDQAFIAPLGTTFSAK
jgi:hypothetical protein